MKKFIFIGLLFVVMQISAQERIEIHQGRCAIKGKMQPAFIVDIPQTTSKKALKLWENTLVPKNLLYKFKRLPKMEKEENNKWVMRGVIIDKICPDSLDIYTRINDRNGKITFAVVLFNHKGIFIGKESEPEITENTRSYIREYAIEAYKQAIQEKCKRLKKELKKMQNEYSGYENENKKMERKIEEEKADMTRLENDLTEIRKILRSDNATNPSSGKRKKEIKKEEKKTSKEIRRKRNAIGRHAGTIDKNKTRQEELLTLIDSTKSEIQKITEKFNNIK